MIDIRVGDCREVLAAMPDACAEAMLSDPPYGLSEHGDVTPLLRAWLAGEPYRHGRPGFMGRDWDAMVPGPEVWREAFRVLRPGAHALVFAGTRSQDLMALSLRLAGFEIRDTLMWVYGSGFPKSLDVSKAIDKAAGAHGEYGALKPNVHSRGEHRLHDGWKRPWQDDPAAIDRCGRAYAPATEGARQWSGYGTALKPGWEPVILARKPLGGTVAATVQEHGAGALNIDGCRVPTTGLRPARERRSARELDATRSAYGTGINGSRAAGDTEAGRWPANVVHDGSGDVLEAFPNAPGALRPVRGNEASLPGYDGGFGRSPASAPRADTGTAARFFYAAKAARSERWIWCPVCQRAEPAAAREMHRHDRADLKHLVAHPTVKPLALTEYLARLVLPPDGIGRPRRILVPYAGSGSEMVGAVRAGWDEVVGIERDPAYAGIARHRAAA